MVGASGISVLGLNSAQNRTTLNGMAFGGAGLPRDAQVQVRLATSPYDPSRGGFSGAETAVELSSGGPFLLRRAHLTLDAPALQSGGLLGDPASQRFTAASGSIGSSGEAVENVWYYNGALQVARRSSRLASLFSVNDPALTQLGIVPDSVRRLRQALDAAHLPLDEVSGPANATSQSVVYAVRIDHEPYLPGTFDPAPSTWNISLFGNLQDDRAEAAAPTAAATTAGRNTALFTGGQANYSRYVGDVLNDARMGVSVRHERGSPLWALPAAVVRLTPDVVSEGGAAADLTVAGSGEMARTVHEWTWETINETQWYLRGTPHRLKVALETRLDGYSRTPGENRAGTFVFPTLAALGAGQPQSFSRLLSAPTRSGTEGSAYVALGDYWRVSPALEVLYGFRLEGNRFTSKPAENAAIASGFGVATSHLPNTIHASPRIGFTWTDQRSTRQSGSSVSNYALQTTGGPTTIRGGVGEFRDALAPALVADVEPAVGDGGTRLSCVGDAAPIPDWTAYRSTPETIPSACLSGATRQFTDTAPGVRFFDRDYTSPRSWRANLTVSRVIGPFSLSLEGIYSLNRNQGSMVDLNLRDAPLAALVTDGGRPLFVSTTGIVPTTGAVSPVEARRMSAFGPVLSMRSDARSTSRQLTVAVTPSDRRRTYFSVAYTLGDVKEDARGFDRPTFYAPFLRETAAGDLDVRHQIIAAIGAPLPYGMHLGLFGRFMSGLPFTPLIGSDVNGDGLVNDRAFIPAQSNTTDQRLAAGMADLLASGPDQARRCIASQLGRPAERNSCRGPWTATVNARIGILNHTSFTSRGYSATLSVANLIGGIDQLLHGSARLQGWGGGAMVDPTLLTVRGFDPSQSRFLYDVNPRFGSTRSAQSGVRVPFRITLDVNIDLGVPMEKQQAVRLLDPGRRNRETGRLSADSMVTLLQRQVPDLYTAILREPDSLLISPTQVEQLRAAQVGYRKRMDALWRSAGERLAALGERYDADAAMYTIDEATEQAWLLNRDELAELEKILSPIQMQLAPWVPRLRQAIGKKRVGIRLFSF
jgi:hypothetical protein